MSPTIALLFLSVSHTFYLPKGMLSALCFVESSHRVQAINRDDGDSHSLGICQVKYTTAQMLGYKGTAKRLQNDAAINIYYAGKYLHTQIRRYKAYDFAVAAYNSGSLRLDESGQIRNLRYVNKVWKAWKEGR